MRKPQTIICYLAWCGAEVTYSFAGAEEYERVRAFLGKHSKAHASHEGLSSALSEKGVTDYYVIEKRDRTAFRLFMSDNR